MLLRAGLEVNPPSAGQFMSAYPNHPVPPALAHSFSRPLAWVLCLIGLAVNCVILGPSFFRSAPQRSDFHHFYIGAKLAGSGSFYDRNRIEAAQREAFGYSNPHLAPVVRLPFYYALLSPLGRLPYQLAFLLWTTSTTLAALFFVSLYPGVRRRQFAIASCWSLPLVVSIAIGQDVSFILLILAVTLRVLYAGNSVLAGVILSLCAIKFNLFVLLPLLFLGKREWRLAAGFSMGTIVLLAVSFTVAGPSWVRPYIASVLDPVLSPNPFLMPNLHSLLAHIPGRDFVEFFLSLMVIAIVWWIARLARFEVALAATLLGSILLMRHVYLQDCAVLAGSLATVFEKSTDELVRNTALILLLPIVYLFVFFRNAGVVAALLLLLLVAMGLAEIRKGVRNGRSQVTSRDK